MNQDITEKYKQALALIEQSKNVLITGHTRPDGDSCGSAGAVSKMLISMGKNVVPFMITPCSDDFMFLTEGLDYLIADEKQDIALQINSRCKDIDLVVIVDTNSRNQLPRFEKWLDQAACKVIVFDHHITADGLGDVEIVDTSAAAAGQVVCSFMEAMNIKITPDIANLLFTAIAADTGWFRFGNRNKGSVYEMAGRLIDKGAEPTAIYEKLFQQMSEGKLKLLARAIDSMQLCLGGQVATQILLLEDFAATGTRGRDTGGIVQEPHKIIGVDTSVIFIEQPEGGFKCSMRSKGKVNVRKIAQKYDGGGHDLAAGATIDMPIAELKELIIGEIEAQINGI